MYIDIIMSSRLIAFMILFTPMICACGGSSEPGREIAVPEPREIIDLGALVTEDLPERVWGKAIMSELGYDDNNSFDVIHWDREFDDGTVSGSNAYYTLFNHGGPHVDAPNHMGLGSSGVDAYPVAAFAGRLKVIDVSGFPLGRSVPVETIRAHDVQPGDIVLIFTNYQPPRTDIELPHRIALTQEAAEYLATLPVRAFGTDAFNVESNDNPTPVDSDQEVQRVAPIHYAFLSRGIPIFEQLFNVDQLLDKQNMYFVGPPLNVKDGDGMIVRPVVLVY